MAVEKPKGHRVKAKNGSKRKTHTIIKKKGVTRANIALNKKLRALANAEEHLKKYRAALAAAAAAEEDEEDEEDEDEEEEDEDEDEEEEDEEEEDEEDFENAMKNANKPGYTPYVSNKNLKNANAETEMYEMFKKL
jgi:ribosomal protein L12E/L44/L45/RPP1/RPP2